MVASEYRLFNHNCQVAPICTRLIHGSLDLGESLPPNDISIGSAIFAGFTCVMNKQSSDRQTISRRTYKHPA